MKQLTDEVFAQVKEALQTAFELDPETDDGDTYYSKALAALDTAQPERAPLSDQQKRILFECVEQVKDGNELDCYLLGFEAAERAHGIKQGGQQ